METIELGSIQETLLLPLWGRAIETQKQKPLLVDTLALSIIQNIQYDFKKIEKNINPLSRAAWIARSLYFDEKIRAFLSKHPDGTVVNIGCGLDTTFDRVNNGISIWYEIDFPDVIELRRKFIKESEKRIFIAESVLSNNWYRQIKNKEHIFLLMAGIIYYIEENSLKKLFNELCNNFKDITIALDYNSEKGVEIANKKVISKSGMKTESKLVWGTDNILEIEKWNERIKVIENMPVFKKYKKYFPFYKRIGMNISDALKIMSLAEIKISGL